MNENILNKIRQNFKYKFNNDIKIIIEKEKMFKIANKIWKDINQNYKELKK